MRYLFIILSILFTCSLIAEENEVIKIGWIGPLSGNAAILGVDAVEATKIAFDEINANGGVNGRQLKLIVEDDQYITKNTISSYNKLVKEQGIDVIYIFTYGGLFALAPKAEKDNVLLIDPLDCDEKIASLPSNIICVSKLTEDLGALNANYAAKEGIKSVGMIYYEGDPFMGTAAEATMKRLKELGVKVAFSDGYLTGETNFKSMLLKAKAKKVNSLFFYGYDEMGTAMKQARELGFTIPFYSLNTITSPGFQDAGGSALEGTRNAGWKAPRTKEFEIFLEKFKKRVGRSPNFEVSTIPSYDISFIISKGLKNKNRVKEEFYSLKNYQGLSGVITVDSDGATRSLKNSMYLYKKGELILLE